jgi:hypothetical protein
MLYHDDTSIAKKPVELRSCVMSARDTAAAAREAQLRVLRSLGPARRAELALEMSEQARAVALAGVLAREPGLSPEQARARLLRRVLGAALFDAAWAGRTAR